jgi:hypothetical protein
MDETDEILSRGPPHHPKQVDDLLRYGDASSLEIELPVAHLGDSLGLLQPGLADAQTALGTSRLQDIQDALAQHEPADGLAREVRGSR